MYCTFEIAKLFHSVKCVFCSTRLTSHMICVKFETDYQRRFFIPVTNLPALSKQTWLTTSMLSPRYFRCPCTKRKCSLKICRLIEPVLIGVGSWEYFFARSTFRRQSAPIFGSKNRRRFSTTLSSLLQQLPAIRSRRLNISESRRDTASDTCY